MRRFTVPLFLQACFSPDGKYIAVGTEGGAVVIWDHNFDNLKVKPRRVKSSTEMHKATVIKALHWDHESSRVYVALYSIWDISRRTRGIVVVSRRSSTAPIVHDAPRLAPRHVPGSRSWVLSSSRW